MRNIIKPILVLVLFHYAVTWMQLVQVRHQLKACQSRTAQDLFKAGMMIGRNAHVDR